MTWNHDFTEAPRDGTQILVATTRDNGRLFLTSWLEPNRFSKSGRWDGFPADAKTLLAWSAVLAHPNVEAGHLLTAIQTGELSVVAHAEGSRQ